MIFHVNSLFIHSFFFSKHSRRGSSMLGCETLRWAGALSKTLKQMRPGMARVRGLITYKQQSKGTCQYLAPF